MTKDKFVSLGFLLLEVFDCQSNANLTKAQFVFASWFPGLRRTFLLAFGVWFYAVVYICTLQMFSFGPVASVGKMILYYLHICL